MLTVFAPTAGASDGSWVALDEKLDLALKDLNLDRDSVEELISGKKTKGDREILLISKKKKVAKKKEKKEKKEKKVKPVKVKGNNVVKFKPGKKLKD